MATSKLQQYVSEQLSIHFGQFTIQENIRPEWLTTEDGARLELDFYIDELDFAIEVQGDQHYEYVEFFHQSYENFEKRKAYDKAKAEVCEYMGIRLYEVFDDFSAQSAFQAINSLIGHDDENHNGEYQPIGEEMVGAFLKKKFKFMVYDVLGSKHVHKLPAVIKLRDFIADHYDDLCELAGARRVRNAIKLVRNRYDDAVEASNNPPPLPQPSMPRLVRRAKTQLSIKQFSNETYLVTGGSEPHIVALDQNGIPSCDCRGFIGGGTDRCSHIWRYYLTFGEDTA